MGGKKEKKKTDPKIPTIPFLIILQAPGILLLKTTLLQTDGVFYAKLSQLLSLFRCCLAQGHNSCNFETNWCETVLVF